MRGRILRASMRRGRGLRSEGRARRRARGDRLVARAGSGALRRRRAEGDGRIFAERAVGRRRGDRVRRVRTSADERAWSGGLTDLLSVDRAMGLRASTELPPLLALGADEGVDLAHVLNRSRPADFSPRRAARPRTAPHPLGRAGARGRYLAARRRRRARGSLSPIDDDPRPPRELALAPPARAVLDTVERAIGDAEHVGIMAGGGVDSSGLVAAAFGRCAGAPRSRSSASTTTAPAATGRTFASSRRRCRSSRSASRRPEADRARATR